MADGIETVHEGLRGDVRLLGELLGNVLAAREGQAFFELVEEVRQLSKRAREGDEAAASALSERIAGLDTRQSTNLARAFGHFLMLANVAEQYHRVRRRRERRRAGSVQPGAFDEALPRLVQQGVSPAALAALLSKLRVELVLTAHPTQAIRRTVQHKHRRIAQALAEREDADVTPMERSAADATLEREILSLWLTDGIRSERPTPRDEASSGFAVIEDILWDELPATLRELDVALRAAAGVGLAVTAAPIVIASWMGGDRDGNPHVTAEVTRQVFLDARIRAARLFAGDVRHLIDELSLTEASPALRAVAGEGREPYRTVLIRLLDRLEATVRALAGHAPAEGALREVDRRAGAAPATGGQPGPRALDSPAKPLHRSHQRAASRPPVEAAHGRGAGPSASLLHHGAGSGGGYAQHRLGPLSPGLEGIPQLLALEHRKEAVFLGDRVHIGLVRRRERTLLRELGQAKGASLVRGGARDRVLGHLSASDHEGEVTRLEEQELADRLIERTPGRSRRSARASPGLADRVVRVVNVAPEVGCLRAGPHISIATLSPRRRAG